MSEPPEPFPPPGYRRWSRDRRAAIVADDTADAVAGILDEGTSLARWAADHAERTTRGGRGPLHAVLLGDVLSAVRHCRRGGWMGPLLGDVYLGRPPRPFRELAVSHALREAGVRTPRVVAAVVEWVGPAYRADLATEWLEPGHDLEALLRPGAYPAETRRRALGAAGREIGRAHRAGLVHPDLQHRNVFVRPAGDEWEAWLLDLDRARIEGAGDHAGRALDRLERSLDKGVRQGRIVVDEDDLAAIREAHDETLQAGR